ncbi:MAG: DUF5329 family protein [Planctomycetota bacterium]
MVNLLVGRDYVKFHIGDPQAVCYAQIESILERIEESVATFVVRGAELNGQEMASRLRRDYRRLADRIHSGDEFIARVATRPSPSADEYLVRSSSGTETPLARWDRAGSNCSPARGSPRAPCCPSKRSVARNPRRARPRR